MKLSHYELYNILIGIFNGRIISI